MFKLNLSPLFYFRFDIAYPTRGFMLKALTLQNGTVSIILYFAALVVSLSNGALEDKIHLYDQKPLLWNVTSVSAHLNTQKQITDIIYHCLVS